MYFDKLSDLGIKLRRKSGAEKTTCPKCSESRRNKKDPCLSVNITTGEYCCHNCAWKGNVRFTEKRAETKKYERPQINQWYNLELNDKIVNYAKMRGVSRSTLKKFGIYGKEEYMPQTQHEERCICFPYLRNNEIINIKFRDGRKDFKLVKNAELIFFGMQTLEGRHCAIITEGEWDALAAYEAGFGQDYPLEPDKEGVIVEHDLGRWAVLSVPNGASKGNQRLDYIDNCSDWLSSVDEFVIATDGDEAGIQLKDELIRRFGVEKCRVLNYPSDTVIVASDGSKRPCKDLNEVLLNFGKDKVIECVLASSTLPIDGINYLEDVFESMLINFRKGIQLAPTTRFKAVDEYFRWKKGDINLFSGYANYGKALSLDTKIPTIEGWTTMGEIKIGDIVFDEKGIPCVVTNVTDVMFNRECYELIFNDGTKIVADAEHLWRTYTNNARLSEKNNKKVKKGINSQQHKRILPSTRTTNEIIDTFLDKRGRPNHSIDYCDPIILPEKDLLIDPYVLGCWIGDGCSDGGRIACDDLQVITNIEERGFKTSKNKAKFMYTIFGLVGLLYKCDLIKNKHIPVEYRRSSINQRLDLLRGLMDTDGYIDKNGNCEFTTIKKGLSNQVYEIITSLGIKATIYECDAKLNGRFISKKYRICFKPQINVFLLERKAKRHNNNVKCKYRFISSYKKIDSVPVRCISVDSESELYLCTDSFIPTHNTTYAIQLMLIKSIYDGWKWAVFSPENYPANDFYDDIVEMYAGKWLTRMSEDEYLEACSFINEHIFYVYPENDHDIQSIHEKFRYLVLKKGVDGVMIDPFNQLDKNQRPYERDDQYLSEILKEIKRFALLNSVVYNIIIHPKNPAYEKDKPLPAVRMYDLAGGAMWGNKADSITIYDRPEFHKDKNSPLVKIHQIKTKRKRTGGQNGEFDLILLWSRKRFTDPITHETPCDPVLARKIKEGDSEDTGDWTKSTLDPDLF